MRILEFEMWYCCPNDCEFCTLYNIKNDHSPNIKLSGIKKSIDVINSTNWDDFDEIALVGGEINVKLPPNILCEFEKLLDIIIGLLKVGKIKKLYVMTSLLNRGNVLPLLIDKFKKENIPQFLSINTSYDTKWRFTPANRKIWDENIKYVEDNGINVHIESIITGDFIEKYLSNDKELLKIIGDGYKIDLIRPAAAFGKSRDDMPDNFFPKRERFMAFLKKLEIDHPMLFNKLLDIKLRASKIFSTSDSKIIERDFDKEVENIKEEILPCGHNKVFAMYSDSNRCALCDLKVFRKHSKGWLR